jgi:triphosphatase
MLGEPTAAARAPHGAPLFDREPKRWFCLLCPRLAPVARTFWDRGILAPNWHASQVLNREDSTNFSPLWENPVRRVGGKGYQHDGLREVELKLEIEPAALARLARHPRIRATTQGRAQTRQLHTVYFDTEDLALARNGLELRVRRAGRTSLQTVKAQARERGALFDRAESECPVAGNEPQIEKLPDPSLRELVRRATAGRPLRPVFEIDVRRTQRRLREGENELLLCQDVGEIFAASQREPICELELEIRQGTPAFAFEVALELQSLGMRPSRASKAARGYALLTGERPQPRKARRLKLNRQALLHEVLASIVSDCLAQIRANEVPACEGIDPEGVHQLRVGVRRLRSALRLFQPLLPRHHVRSLNGELRWLASELGPARDLDVFVDELIGPLASAHPDDPALKTLRDEAVALRTESQRRVGEALLSSRYTRLVLQMGHWLARAAWTDQALSEESARLYLPARLYTSELLERMHRKAVRLGRRLEQGSIEERHLLRIRLKRLRYAAEFFRSLYPGRRARRYLERLSQLQDVLGELNDVATADRLLAQLLSRVEPASVNYHAAGFVAGWKGHTAEQRLAQLEALWEPFEASRCFWRD